MSFSSDSQTYRVRGRELRRAHIVRAMAELAYERGFQDTSLAALCALAGVSRTGFYELFDSRQDCFLAVLDQCHDRACALLRQRLRDVEDWRVGLRDGLAALLQFLDGEPQLARVSIIESLAAGQWALERRERHVSSLTRLLVENWGRLAPPEPHPFTHVGVMASVLGIIQSHLARRAPQPLIALLGPLVGSATAPYLGAGAAAEDTARAAALARELLSTSAARPQPTPANRDLPALLTNPRAHRARECVLCIAEHPGISNREVAQAIGLASHTQTTTLLRRLHDEGLLHKRPGLPGRPNAWALSTEGERAARLLASFRSREVAARLNEAQPHQHLVAWARLQHERDEPRRPSRTNPVSDG